VKNTEKFVASFSFDARLAPYDIAGSVAHVKMLSKTKIIPSKDAQKIIKGLLSIDRDLKKGFKLPEQEDIHYAIEKELMKRIGTVGGKMHTARSRNDQVSLDLRLYLKDEISALNGLIEGTQAAIVKLAQKNINVIMPGYTHLQIAQPILFSHHIMAYGWMFERDKARLSDALKRVNVLPLGSAALAGTSFKIDRRFTAGLLGFAKVSENSMDSVSDRDFAVELLAALSIMAVHLSRLAEELVLWSSSEFDFVKLADDFVTGSSIMPQKRNPDVAELIRGKTGKVFGNLVNILTTLKALPLSYNRDLQEDKPPVFDSIDTVKDVFGVLIPMLSTMELKEEKMELATRKGYLSATELADYLARQGVAFREAHGTVKSMVNYCETNKKLLDQLTPAELKKFSPHFKSDVHEILKPVKIVEQKTSEGGTSTSSVNAQIKQMKGLIKKSF
jgi:argininosuccinate lyase